MSNEGAPPTNYADEFFQDFVSMTFVEFKERIPEHPHFTEVFYRDMADHLRQVYDLTEYHLPNDFVIPCFEDMMARQHTHTLFEYWRDPFFVYPTAIHLLYDMDIHRHEILLDDPVFRDGVVTGIADFVDRMVAAWCTCRLTDIPPRSLRMKVGELVPYEDPCDPYDQENINFY